MYTFERFYNHKRVFDLLDRYNAKPWQWIVLSVLVAGADFLSDARIHFPILYIVPIAIVGWYGKQNQALSLAIIFPFTRLIFRTIWDVPWIVVDSIINVLIRIIVFVSLAYLISFIREIHILRGFIHVCCHCGRVKNEKENWIPLQEYVSEHSEALFSHGVCPECAPKYYK